MAFRCTWAQSTILLAGSPSLGGWDMSLVSIDAEGKGKGREGKRRGRERGKENTPRHVFIKLGWE